MKRDRSGFTLVELLVVIAIIGVLVALLLPAVQAAREAARRSSCSNNLKQIGLSLHNYHDTYLSFPPGWIDTDGVGSNSGRLHAWSTFILPFMEENNIYENIAVDFGSATSPANVNGAGATIDGYRCPSSILPDTDHNGYGTTNYNCSIGNGWQNQDFGGVFRGNSKIKFRDITDGSNNTIMVAEVEGPSNTQDGFPVWCQVDNAGSETKFAVSSYGNAGVFINKEITSSGCTHNHCDESWASRHPGGAQFTFADASVHFLTETIDTNVFQNLGRRNDGNVVGEY